MTTTKRTPIALRLRRAHAKIAWDGPDFDDRGVIQEAADVIDGLAKALRELRAECDAQQYPEIRDADSPFKELLEQADAALAKAEGKE